MANEQNLRKLTTEQAREIGRMGGKASVIAKRRLKTFKQAAKHQLTEQDENGETAIWCIVARMIKEAKQGNIKAAEFLRDLNGEKPTDKVEANVKNKSAPVIVFDIPRPPDAEEPQQP